MSNCDWPELEDAKRKRKKRKEELRALKAEIYILFIST